MNHMAVFFAFTLAVGLVACSETDFSSDSRQKQVARKEGKKPPGSDDGNPASDPNTSDGNQPPGAGSGDSGLATNSGKVELVQANLTITRNLDNAKNKNCVKANIVGEAPTELGCNRVSPGGARTALVSNVSIKVKTNTCNILSLTLTTDSGSGPKVLTSSANFQRFIVKKLGSNNFNVRANDNNDDDWHDLDLDIKSTDSRVKFTIENSGGCD